jgi:hypothetical protein
LDDAGGVGQAAFWDHEFEGSGEDVIDLGVDLAVFPGLLRPMSSGW